MFLNFFVSPLGCTEKNHHLLIKKNFSVGGYVEALPFSHYFES
jgi:hypothetical protein